MCPLNPQLTAAYPLLAARNLGIQRYFYACPACIYTADKQTSSDITALMKESDAYPAIPEDGCGWEKLFSERMRRHFREYSDQTYPDRS